MKLTLVTLFSITPNRTKSEGIAKDPYVELKGKKIIANQKIRPPRYLAQISIWMIGLGILDVQTQVNSLKIKWIQRLLNPTNAVWKNLMLYQLNLILNYNQELAFLDKNKSLG